MTEKDSDWISTEEAAQLSGYSQGYIRQLINKGLINGRKVIRDWLVDSESLTQFVQRSLEKRKDDKRFGPDA